MEAQQQVTSWVLFGDLLILIVKEIISDLLTYSHSIFLKYALNVKRGSVPNALTPCPLLDLLVGEMQRHLYLPSEHKNRGKEMVGVVWIR